MTAQAATPLDVLIFGGGVAGLWLLDTLTARGYAVLLLEADALGAGQSVAAQGIIHGGLKYTLDGLLSDSAAAIAEMPLIWRECLSGRRRPDLRATRVRAEYCHLWRTDALRSRLGMLGARAGLRVAPRRLAADEWPAALRGCPGDVYRLDEQVIDPVSLLETLRAAQPARIVSYSPAALEIAADPERALTIAAPGVAPLRLRPRRVVLCAGNGNDELRRRFGLSAAAMQRRPLHMVLLRGRLPHLNGHCTDSARTRVTITSADDSAGRAVWQVGGQLAEAGVELQPDALLAHAARELAACLPAFDAQGVEWSCYRVDRAEAATAGRTRPSDVAVLSEGDILTVWPTKLALAPRLAECVAGLLPPPEPAERDYADLLAALAGWPRPPVAPPPWEQPREWRHDRN